MGFILLTLEPWAAGIAPGTYRMNECLTDEELVKGRARTLLSEETPTWGGNEFGHLLVVIRGLL